jgi:hypothetical protein
LIGGVGTEKGVEPDEVPNATGIGGYVEEGARENPGEAVVERVVVGHGLVL